MNGSYTCTTQNNRTLTPETLSTTLSLHPTNWNMSTKDQQRKPRAQQRGANKKLRNKNKASKPPQKPQPSTTKRAMAMSRRPPIRSEPYVSKLSNQPNKMVLGFTLPHMFPTPRLSTIYNDFPTATASPFLVRNLDWTSPSPSTTRSIPPGQFVAAVCRNPLASVVQYYEYPENMVSEYNFWFASPYNGSPFSERFVYEVNMPTATGFPFDLNLQTGIDPEYLQDNRWGDNLYSHPHGYYYYAVDAAGRKGFYVSNPDTRLELISKHYTSPSDAVGTALFRVLYWNNSVWDRTANVIRMDVNDPIDTHATLTFDKPGYYAVECEFSLHVLTSNQQAFEYAVSLWATGNQWGFSPMSYVENVQSSIGGIRVPAVSIMLTQRSAVLSEGGQICGCQLKNGESWESPIISGDPYSELSSRSTAWFGNLKHGIYGFLKPSTQVEFDLQRCFEVEDGEVVGYHNPIQPIGSWLMVCAHAPPFTVPNSYPGGLAYLTVNYGVEFVTDNIWFSQFISESTSREFEQALEILKSTTQWHENPMHFRDLVRSAMSAGRTALKLAPSIAKIVGTLVPGVAPSTAVVNALASLGRAL